MQIKSLVKKLTPTFLLDFYYWLWAFAGAVVFGFPSSKLIIIGVTGTSGKSTTVDFITRILEEAGQKVASTSSIRFKVAEKEWKNKMKMTMPGRFVIQIGTTVDFITRILEEAGQKVASTSSIRFKVAEKEWKNKMKMTMPGRFVI